MTTASTHRRHSRCHPVVRACVTVSLFVWASACAGAAPTANLANDPRPAPTSQDHEVSPGSPDPSGRAAPLRQALPGDETPPPAPHSHGGHATMQPDTIPPEDYAVDGIARVEVAANVDVAVHWVAMKQYHFPSIVDTTAGGTGAFINPSGTLVTSPEAVRLDRERITVYAVNQAWHQALGIPLPADPYEHMHVPGRPKLEAAVNACYRLDKPGKHCAVTITPEIKVHPYTAADKPPTLTAALLSTSASVAVLSVAIPGKTATVALGPAPQAGKPWTAISWPTTPAATAKPATVQGRYDAKESVSAQDIATLRTRLGTGMSGAVLVNARGAVTGILSPTGHSVDVVPPDRITEALDKGGVQSARGPGDSSMANGLRLYAKHEYRHAATWLHSAADDTGQGAVAVRYHEAAHANSGTPADMSDEVDAHTGHNPAASGTDWTLIGPIIGLVVLAVGALAFALRHRRLRLVEETATAGPSLADARATLVSTLFRGFRAAKNEPPTAPIGSAPSAGEDRERSAPDQPEPYQEPDQPEPYQEENAATPSKPQGTYCARCGAFLSPGDRFCFACGAASPRR
ncbi:zinc ribbon domain-containing protein [Streptomyces sp. NPDC059697]|uniref:zinc ribbon domain-containing protein n=1 Tax=Streptomyces sp. NPDC059697 TaxID=3346912 RepID=UPI0036836FC4